MSGRMAAGRRAGAPVPAAVIVGGLVVLGVLQGVVWSQVAPGQQALVYPDGSYGSLPTADYHPFTALAIFVLAGIAVGLVAAVAAWRVRGIRGTTTLLALFAGASAGAAVAFGVGFALVSGVNPATVGATGHSSIVVAAPTLATPLVLVAEPAAAVLVYTFLVAWDGRPDLGRERPSEQAGVAALAPGEGAGPGAPGAAVPSVQGPGTAGPEHPAPGPEGDGRSA